MRWAKEFVLRAELRPPGIPGPANCEHSWQAVVDRRQLREYCVRLGLIPIRDRIIVVRTHVRVPVLDRGFDRFRKWDWRIQMKTVNAAPASYPLLADNRGPIQRV